MKKEPKRIFQPAKSILDIQIFGDSMFSYNEQYEKQITAIVQIVTQSRKPTLYRCKSGALII